MKKSVYDKLEEQISNFNVIQIFSFMKQSLKSSSKNSEQGKQGSSSLPLTYNNIIILSKPPKVIYKSLKTKIGAPRDYEINLKEGFPEDKVHIGIPKEVIRQAYDSPG